MAESTRPLPSLIPLADGGWEATSYLSSAEYTIRGLGLMPPNTVIPVIVVPGIMGTNLRAKMKPRLGRLADERNLVLKPGEPAWRPPNGVTESAREASIWREFKPDYRQRRLDSNTLEVDGNGEIQLPDGQDGYVIGEAEVRARGWGELHADSYGTLLCALQTKLNQTFGFNEVAKKRFVKRHWREVMLCDPRRWGVRELAPLTEVQLERHAKNYFPVYAVGYNWLEDCAISAQRLERRILEIINAWKSSKRQCDKVILITHSMGGLVARACAKRIPDKIAGVIHGVMPALGAAAAYRRIACGTEGSSPSNGVIENIVGARIASILGETALDTTPAMATSAGAAELLPNHLYPQPWMHVRVLKVATPIAQAEFGRKDDVPKGTISPHEYLHLPAGKASNPYDLYRDTTHWYRLVDPAIADPAQKYRARPRLEKAINRAITAAERFHRSLGDYYHPNTYAFYGDDKEKLAFGEVRWVARQGPGSTLALTAANIANGQFLGYTQAGHRRVLIGGTTELAFWPEAQDARGDGTVPIQSGSGPAGKVKQVFAVQGIDHQTSYNNADMLLLTLRLVAKIVQEMS
jgi:pimeloyl-ACP methyl ester carboxylesterase